jgi:hypothetical protein
VDKATLGQVISAYFGLPCQSFYRLLHIRHHPPSGAGPIGLIVAEVPSGLSLIPPQEIKKMMMMTTTTAADRFPGQKKTLLQIQDFYCCSLWLYYPSTFRGNSHFPSFSCISFPSLVHYLSPSSFSFKLTQRPHLNSRRLSGDFPVSY